MLKQGWDPHEYSSESLSPLALATSPLYEREGREDASEMVKVLTEALMPW
jgi:hypothetical protein